MLNRQANKKTSMDVRKDMLTTITQQLGMHAPRRLPLDLPEAAVLIPVTRSETSPEIILTRRSRRLNTHKGEVAFPGGKRDQEDSDLSHTALRESHEEIGLPADQVDLLGSTGEVVSGLGIKVTPFVGVIDPDVELIANPYELDRIFRVPLNFLLDKDQLQRDKLNFRNGTFYAPVWQFEEYRIWGLTAIMLVEFLNVTLNANIPLDVPHLFGERFQASRK